MDTYYDTDSQWKMDKFVSREGNDRSKMLKTANIAVLKHHDDGPGPAGLKRVKRAPKMGKKCTENGCKAQ